MSLKLLSALIVALAVAVGVVAQTYVNNVEAQGAGGMTLTVRNVTGGNPLTPPIAIVHDGSVITGASALDGLAGLEELAEAGAQEPLATTLAGLGSVSEVVKIETAPIPGGEEATGTVMAMPGDYVTVVAMLACTNDAIAVGTAIVSESGAMSSGRVYDAGTEVNSETAASVPCLGGAGVSDASGEGSLMLHGGIMGGADLDATTHGWDVAAMQLFVHTAGTDAPTAANPTLTLENLTAGQPITPPVVVVHDPNVAPLTYESPDDLDGIDDLSEGGVTGDLIATLGGRPGVLSAFVLNTGGPILPGQEYNTVIDGVDGAAVSVAGMFACTNDAYILATAMIELDDDGKPTTLEAIASVIDSGSESNDETAGTVPCLGGEALSSGLGEGSRSEHAGIQGGADLDPQTHGWTAETTAKLTLCNLRADQPEWTKTLVQQAVDRYKKTGLEETTAYYNTDESRDGQWYVFIADRSSILRSHVTHVGWLLDRVLGPDGYPAGKMVNAVADEDGSWVSYTYVNPASGEVERKHSWAIRHNGILFGSGWYEPGAPKSDPAAYTKEFVQRATDLYDVLGIEDTVEYYNMRKSVDGQWYVAIADENNVNIAYPTHPHRIGMSLEDSVTFNSYPVGAAIVAVADEDGGWTSYTHTNPATGVAELKHAWAIRHDGLLFGSGWYEPSPSKDDPEAYTKAFVEQAVELHKAVGDERTIAYYNTPESVDGEWYVFVVQGDAIVAHATVPENIGQSLLGPLGTDSTGEEFGSAIIDAPEGGAWVDYTYLNPALGGEEIKHTWVVRSGDLVFGSGWYEPVPAPTPAPEPTPEPVDEMPETGDFSLTAGWALALALAGALIALGGAVTIARQRGR